MPASRAPLANLPETITVDFQPYGLETLGDLTVGSYNGYPTLKGTVITGTTTGRLFGHTHTRSTAGERREVYGVQQWEVDRGHIVRIACG